MGCGCGYKQPKIIADKWYPDYVASLPRMDGKVVAITGSTTGTGLSCAQTCRRLGATVVLLNRESDRVAKAKRSVSQSGLSDPLKSKSDDDPTSPVSVASKPSIIDGQMRADADQEQLAEDPNVVIINCDLSTFASVRIAVSELNEKFGKSGIDILVNNAGVMALKDEATEDGFDIQMQVNHLSHFLLTHGIMSLLETAATQRGEARVVNHSSIMRNDVKKKGIGAKYLEKNGGNLGGNGAGGKWPRYAQTKWANMVFTHALHDHLTKKGSKVKVAVAHPGIAATNLQVTTVQDGGMPGFAATAIVSQSANDGALGIIHATCNGSVKSCDFFGPKKDGWKGPADLLPKDNVSEAEKALLWEKSEAACGISFSSS